MRRVSLFFCIIGCVLTSCGESHEKTKHPMSFMTLDFRFPDKGDLLTGQAESPNSFSEHILDQFSVKHYKVDSEQDAVIRMAFVRKEKFNAEASPAHCLQTGELKIFDVNVELPYAILRSDGEYQFKSPFTLFFNSDLHNCIVEHKRKFEFDRENFLYHQIALTSQVMSESPIALSGGKTFEWAVTRQGSDYLVFTKTTSGNEVTLSKALYVREKLSVLNEYFNGWEDIAYEANSNENIDSSAHGTDANDSHNGSNSDEGAVTITIPEEWFL